MGASVCGTHFRRDWGDGRGPGLRGHGAGSREKRCARRTQDPAEEGSRLRAPDGGPGGAEGALHSRLAGRNGGRGADLVERPPHCRRASPRLPRAAPGLLARVASAFNMDRQ